MNRLMLLLLLLGYARCTTIPTNEQRFRYIPLEDFKYRPASLKPGSEVEVLAFAGSGRVAGTNEFFYYQFLVRTNLGDSARVLVPVIEYRGQGSNKGMEYVSTDGGAAYVFATPDSIGRGSFARLAHYDTLGKSTMEIVQMMKMINHTLLGNHDTASRGEYERNGTLPSFVPQPDDSLHWSADKKMPTLVGQLKFEGKPW